MKKEFQDVIAKDFVIFKAGTWNGETFTEQDLDNMVNNYNAEDPPHIFLGHSSDYKGKTMIPSWGTIKGGLKRIGNELIAVGTEFNEQLAEWIKDGFYPQRSVEISPDNTRLIAVGMMGKTPPAVKGMPLMQEVLSFSINGDSKVIEMSDQTDAIEILAADDTFKNISQCCGEFLANVEKILSEDTDMDKLFNAVWSLQSNLIEEFNVYAHFKEKIESIEEHEEKQMSEKSGWKEFKETVKQLFIKRKDSEVDKVKEQEYQTKISELEAKVKEFADKETIEAEKVKVAEEARVKAEADAKDTVLKEEIKSFCDNAVRENKMTPAMREKDEPIMFELGKSSESAMKSFKEKYSSVIVPLGEVADVNKKLTNDTRPQVIINAEKYVENHPKEFAKMEKELAVSRAIFLHSTGKIKFEDK